MRINNNIMALNTIASFQSTTPTLKNHLRNYHLATESTEPVTTLQGLQYLKR